MIAHQGGWDEAAFVLVPIIIFSVLLLVAKWRTAAEDGRVSDDTD